MDSILLDLENRKDGSQPVYVRIKQFIRQRILSGGWPTGYRLPSEPDLARRLGVSRMTVNRAMCDLALDGLISRRPGVGSFVEELKIRSTFLEIRNIRDEIKGRHHIHSSEICELGKEKAEKDTVARLGIRPGQDVFRSIIIHKENDIPIQLEDRIVNPNFAPDYLLQDFTQTTPNEYLMKQGPLDEIEHIIQSVSADDLTRDLLSMEEGDPILLLKRRTWSGGTVVTSAKLMHPGSRYTLEGRFKPKRS